VRAPWQARLRRDAHGAELERRLPGGVVSRWERDRVGRPAVHRVLQEDTQVAATGYRFRSYEQIAALIDTQRGMTRFEHDARSYLVAAVHPDGEVEHRAPDAAGNVYRSSERRDRVYGRGGRLEQVGGVRCIHDDDGQLVEVVMPEGRSWKYAWDHAGQLEAVTLPDGQKGTFAYDALGRRVRKTFAEKTTTYVWDGEELVHELVEGGELITWVFEPGTFTPLAKIEGKERYSILTDHLGTPELLMDEAGKLAWKAQLDVYGIANVDVTQTRCPWRWPGQYEDEETGLYYNRFRYYDPEAGIYLSQDPIGLLGGANLYGYVPDPLAWIDPLGLILGLYGFPERGAAYIGSAFDIFKRLGKHIQAGRITARSAAIEIAVDVYGATGKDARRILRLAEQEAIEAARRTTTLTNIINAVGPGKVAFYRKLRDWYANGKPGRRPRCK
jgi:RHS repeat-associated protein